LDRVCTQILEVHTNIRLFTENFRKDFLKFGASNILLRAYLALSDQIDDAVLLRYDQPQKRNLVLIFSLILLP